MTSAKPNLPGPEKSAVRQDVPPAACTADGLAVCEDVDPDVPTCATTPAGRLAFVVREITEALRARRGTHRGRS